MALLFLSFLSHRPLKTAFYSFYLPVCLAMVLHQGRVDKEQFRVIADITLPMGEFFQVQDDFLDCYGTPEQIGKVGRDIEEAKCGWIVVTALPLCTPAQRADLEKHYGREDPAGVARVKQIFSEVGIPRIYAEYEESSYKKLTHMIGSQSTVPRAVFDSLLAKIYKRKK